MESFFFLVPIALIFVAIAIRFLFWAINSGQYDNLDTEAHRILFDEDQPSSASAEAAEASDASKEAAPNALDTAKTSHETPSDIKVNKDA